MSSYKPTRPRGITYADVAKEETKALDILLRRDDLRRDLADRYGFADHMRQLDLERKAKPLFVLRRRSASVR